MAKQAEIRTAVKALPELLARLAAVEQRLGEFEQRLAEKDAAEQVADQRVAEHEDRVAHLEANAASPMGTVVGRARPAKKAAPAADK